MVPGRRTHPRHRVSPRYLVKASCISMVLTSLIESTAKPVASFTEMFTDRHAAVCLEASRPRVETAGLSDL